MPQQLSPLKVVLVDDAPLILSRLQTTIASLEGVDVVGNAENVADALAVIERLRPDAIILDVRLPDGNGLQVLQQVKEDAEGPAVIVLTAHPLPQIRERCLALGVDYFFDKSLEFRRVAPALAALAGKRSSNDRHSVAAGKSPGACPPPKPAGDQADGINGLK